MAWITLRSITVNGANAMSGMFAVGYPALTAFSGFAHAVLRNVESTFGGERPLLKGMAIVHHTGRARMYGKYGNKLTERRYVYDRFSLPSKPEHFINPPSEMDPQCDLTFSLCIEADLRPEVAEMLVREHGWLSVLLGSRCMGGTIQGHGKLAWTSSVKDAISAASSGSVIIDQTDSLDDKDGKDALDVLLDRMTAPTAKGAAFQRPLPSQIGYRAISPLSRTRGGVRSNAVDHAFVEPVIGLAEWRKKYDVLCEASLLRRAVWTPKLDRETGIFVLSGVSENG